MQNQRSLFAAAAAVMLVLCSGAFADWEAIGPFGGPVGSIAIAPSIEGIVYAATSPLVNPASATICRSSDTAGTWEKRGTIPTACLSLVVSPLNANVLFAGTNTSVCKSTDGGSTWIAYSPGGSDIYGLAVHAAAPSIVYAAGKMTHGGYTVMAFFKSTDAGLSWTATPLHTVNNGAALSLAVDPASPNTVYIGGNIQGAPAQSKVYKSTNGGSTFTDVSSGFSSGGYAVNGLKVHPTNPGIVYATNFYEGIYRTTNGGASWSQVFTGTFFSCLGVTPALPNIVYAGKDTLVYKSTDSGASWFIPGTGYAGVYKLGRTLAVSQVLGTVLYTGDNRGVFKSTNSGSTWFASTHGMTLAHIANFTNAPSAPWVIYTEFEGVGVHKTTNSGVSWSLLPTPLECGLVCQFAIHNTNPNLVMGLEGSG
jgi:photosystem II stability/assembly factor-like uncharacterized protein